MGKILLDVPQSKFLDQATQKLTSPAYKVNGEICQIYRKILNGSI